MTYYFHYRDNYDAKEPDWSQKHDMVSSKERRSSSSSQHSNHSNHSTWSNLSQQGQGRDQGQSRKRAKLESGKESLSQLSASQTSDHISSSNKHVSSLINESWGVWVGELHLTDISDIKYKKKKSTTTKTLYCLQPCLCRKWKPSVFWDGIMYGKGIMYEKGYFQAIL